MSDAWNRAIKERHSTYPCKLEEETQEAVFVSVNEARRERPCIDTGADHQEDDEEEGLEVEQR